MLPAVGLRTFIWNNLWKSALLLAGFPVLLALLGYAFALMMVAGQAHSLGQGLRDAAAMLPAVLPVALVVAAVWFAIAWVANQRILDAMTGARPVTRREEPRLWNTLETLCISRGERMPRLAVIESPALNAYASGLSRATGAVTVTRGLLQALDERELRAVLAHELTHIRNGDARLAVIAAVFAGVISLPAEMLGRGWRVRTSSSNRDGGTGIVLVLIALAIMAMCYVLAIALRFALSRNREFIADAGAVELTGDPDALISALRKIDARSAMPRLPSGVQAMLIDSPEETLGSAWLATHPAMEKRIGALVQHAGGRDPGPMVRSAAEAPGAQPTLTPAAATPWAGPLPVEGRPWGGSSAPAPAAEALPWWRRG
ncbi:MAG: M48 family metallopeptidase [Acetobacteraceae bacterium]|nr:M48 family metallopeptidase [Acetobacteraceae bacterium]